MPVSIPSSAGNGDGVCGKVVGSSLPSLLLAVPGQESRRRELRPRAPRLPLRTISPGGRARGPASTGTSTGATRTPQGATPTCPSCWARCSTSSATSTSAPSSTAPSVLQATPSPCGVRSISQQIIEAHRELELYVGLDVDPVAHDKARARIEDLLNDNPRDGSLKAYTHVRNFKYIKSVLGGIDENLLEGGVDGILMDLGMSSMQVNNSDRGFSVLGDGPLDMRMNPQASLKAEDILNYWPDSEVGRVLRDYGEESNWRFLQKQIVGARADGGLHSTAQLVDLVRSTSAGSGGRHGWIKTATRVFQALRIAVNDELQTLEDAIHACFDCLSSGGRLVVISFHSLEDRIVKRTFLDIIERGEGDLNGKGQREDEADGGGETWSRHRVQGSHGTVLTKRPITPSKEEEKLNRRCRSAKLRVIRKL
ncbi:ribosomal RNA small subunit methyltransferase H isoform X2 [Phoenix dactylifera]|uniref:Ribosomal RNA small subunit methyltransferase H isoform X2 n=1 Tax=Phoenix dactylifera TaxID=42345 RepID=A0A8B8J922_PHODC|nr:ribosomal RNA small subunit methyltransferase H isoform X2 [Phoenix dactylifera]